MLNIMNLFLCWKKKNLTNVLTISSQEQLISSPNSGGIQILSLRC